jgi:hypothetical protein
VTVAGLFHRSALVLVACAACSGRSATTSSRGAPDDAGACLSASLSLERQAIEVLFAVSTSEGMSRRLDDGRTAYEATAASLAEVFRRYRPRQYVGLALNPEAKDCGSTQAVASGRLDRDGQSDRLIEALGNVTLGGSTSLVALLQSLGSLRAPVPNPHTAVAVFLDGTSESDSVCDGPDALERVAEAAKSLTDQGVGRVVFVAAPGSGAGERARALAEATDCPTCFFDYSDLPDFAEAAAPLGPFAGDIDACDFPLPPTLEGEELDLASLALVAAFDGAPGERIPRVEACGDAPGFIVTDLRMLVFCPATCEPLLDAFHARLELTSECPTP